ncbi:MAG TPA: hypothetical protein VIR15_07140 [Intrasporangium sp.]|jgi:hypothetical protein|uniref:hypothetical protein n=1 Tax=Intrasporangium sp. TaxID=1925024 RepID=UPI002F92CFF1
MHDHPTVVVSPTIDAVTVAEAHRTLLEFRAEKTDPDIAAEAIVAHFYDVLEGYGLAVAA